MSGLLRRLLMAIAFACSVTSATFAAQIKIADRTFTLPDGFTIEQVTTPQIVDRPIVADFDETGWLYVADSSGSGDKVQKQLAEKPHRIVRLDPAEANGHFTR